MGSYVRALIAQRPIAPPTLPPTLAPKLVRLTTLREPEPLDEPLDVVARELQRGLGADGLLVAWHRDAEVVTLFADGRSSPEVISELQRCATYIVLGTGSADTWFIAESQFGDVLLARIPIENGSITVTALFEHAGSASSDVVRERAARSLSLV